ncbi:hypothetical protein [Candidatus Thiodiazotropha sp. CDECU1]|uniref:hypothetical protein n=1 Tax=Candidatus Thiodiazotropha sp. CDECU1 TaxID=3065865 RepID=UPI00292D0BE8|nr:hypothetical protein [Candidatus Thiodiazotropha sp. CDECU1]
MGKKKASNRGRKDSRIQEPTQESSKKGWADVAIRFIDALYDLAQTGNLVGLVLFGVVCWIFYITYKLPAESVEGLLYGIGNFLASESFYIVPFTAVIAYCGYTNLIQKRVYRTHIKDLAEHRQLLIHGLESGELSHLETHHSSEND